MEMQLMLTSMANIPVQTNIWDQDQTAPMRIGSILIASKTSFNNEQVDDIWVVMERKCNLCLRQWLISPYRQQGFSWTEIYFGHFVQAAPILFGHLENFRPFFQH